MEDIKIDPKENECHVVRNIYFARENSRYHRALIMNTAFENLMAIISKKNASYCGREFGSNCFFLFQDRMFTKNSSPSYSFFSIF
jgi:hypothetical protein